MRYQAKDWEAVVEALRNATEITVACHVNPDGDALGSLLGATLGLRKLGKRVHPTFNDDVPTLPFGYSFLPGGDGLVAPTDLVESPVFLALDCGARDRLGALIEPAALRAETLINIDHHPGNEDFGHLNIVVTTASSTAELVTRLLVDAGVELDRDIATCLYTGIVTDTGSFQYSNSTSETLRIAAELLDLGVDKTEIARSVYETAPFGYLQLVALVLSRARLFAEERFIYSYVKLDDLRETSVPMEETDKLIELIRGTRDADVAAIFKEQGDGKFRASMRSKGPVSVGKIARERGGGGHELAAGFTTDSIEKSVAEIVAELKP